MYHHAPAQYLDGHAWYMQSLSKPAWCINKTGIAAGDVSY